MARALKGSVLLATSALVGLTVIHPVQAEPVGPAGELVSASDPTQVAQSTLTFDISASSLEDALNQFSTAADLQLVYSADLVAGLNSPGVQGSFTAEEALLRLLSGTGLRSLNLAEGRISLERMVAEQESGPVRLDTIQVTGERFARTLQRTATSVAVVSEDDIDRKNSDSVYTTLRGVPNVLNSPSGFVPSIRGDDADGPGDPIQATIFGAQRRVALIVDDVSRPMGPTQGGFRSAFDVEQIEVLRGPQTTARGANAIAGAIVVKTKDPVFEQENEILLENAAHDFHKFNYRTALMTNVPVYEGIATRLTVDYTAGEQPLKPFNPDSLTNAQDPHGLPKYDGLNLRNKWLIEPAALPELSMLTSFDWQDGINQRFQGKISTSDDTGQSTDSRYFDFASGLRVDNKVRGVVNNLSYDLSDGLTAKAISSWHRSKTDPADNTQSTGLTRFNTRSISQDLLLELGAPSDQLNGVFGLTYMEEKKFVDLTSSGGVDIDMKSRTSAVFGDVSYGLTDNLRLLAGARFNRYVFNAKLATFGDDPDQSVKEDVFLPKLGLQYDVTPDHTLSVVGRRGYNPASLGVDFTGATFSSGSYDSEFVQSYELTYRGSFQDSLLDVNATTFYNIYNDKQVIGAPSGNNRLTANVNKARSFGLELDTTLRPFDDWTFNTAVGYLNTKITNTDDSDTAYLHGNSFGQDPKYTISGEAIWRPTDELEFSLNGMFVGRYFTDFENNDGEDVGSYALFDFGMAYTYDFITARFFVRNILDRLAIVSRDSDDADVLEPRTVGASLNIEF